MASFSPGGRHYWGTAKLSQILRNTNREGYLQAKKAFSHLSREGRSSLQEIFCPSAGIVLTRVCWYRNVFVGDASPVISPETTSCGVRAGQGNVFLSALHGKVMEQNRRKASAKIPQSTLREKVTGEGKTERESVTRDSLPPPVQSVLGLSSRFPALISLCCPGTRTAQ